LRSDNQPDLFGNAIAIITHAPNSAQGRFGNDTIITRPGTPGV
jgi:hypothetical protein